MELLRLPGTDLTVSRVGFGGWAIGGHGWGPVRDEESIAAVRAALDAGITFFDTADVYGFGHSETVLAQALGERRHDVVIATKFGVTWDAQGHVGRDASPAYLRRAVEESLRRLRLDCIPLYHLHWPDPATPVADTMRALLDLVDEGKIRYVGCSNLPPELAAEAGRHAPLASLQYPFSILGKGSVEAMLPTLERSPAGFVAYDTLAKGLLAGKFSSSSSFGPDDVRSRDPRFRGREYEENLKRVEVLRGIARRLGKTPAQVAVRWVLDHPFVSVALVGCKTAAQARENAGASGWRLPPAEFQELAALLPPGSDPFAGPGPGLRDVAYAPTGRADPRSSGR
jgi:aryl-alcohol dehydrogenase-like predicted oxidoreductase